MPGYVPSRAQSKLLVMLDWEESQARRLADTARDDQMAVSNAMNKNICALGRALAR